MGDNGDPVLQDILVLVKGERGFLVGGDAPPEDQPGLRPVDNLDPGVPEELPDNNRGKLLFYDRLQGLVLKDRGGFPPRMPVTLSSESALFRISSSGVPAGTVILLRTFPLTWIIISLSSSCAISVQ